MSSINKPSFLEKLPGSSGGEKVLLCAHGLNQKPEALKPLLSDLASSGFETYLHHLPGHHNFDYHKKLTAEKYIEDHEKSYQYLKDKFKKPIYFLGYSFGGLIGVHQFKSSPFKKMILLAPALRMRPYTLLLQPLLPFLNHVVSIQMGDDEFEKKYRYHSQGVPADIYKSFFNIYHSQKLKEKNESSESEALIFIHPSDELVNYKALKKYVASQSQWQLKELDNQAARFKRYNHLCFDEDTLGASSYQNLIKEIKNFLN